VPAAEGPPLGSQYKDTAAARPAVSKVTTATASWARFARLRFEAFLDAKDVSWEVFRVEWGNFMEAFYCGV
jgi:hypothetical protein